VSYFVCSDYAVCIASQL